MTVVSLPYLQLGCGGHINNSVHVYPTAQLDQLLQLMHSCRKTVHLYLIRIPYALDVTMVCSRAFSTGSPASCLSTRSTH